MHRAQSPLRALAMLLVLLVGATPPVAVGAPSLNEEPKACFVASPSSGTTATSFAVDASCTTDDSTPPGALSFRWQFGEGQVWRGPFIGSTTFSSGFGACGTQRITLEVEDAGLKTNRTNRTVEVNCAPTLSHVGSAGYASDGVEPDTGDPTTTFVFRVRYADPDGTAPAYVRLHVDGEASPRAMTLESGSFATGAVYVAEAQFHGGTKAYSFTASDGVESATLGADAHPAVVVSNAAPTLAYTGEPGYEGDALEPETGTALTDLAFRVRYADPDGTPPAWARLHVGQATYDLEHVGGDFATGAIIAKTLRLPNGTYAYHFEASDGAADVSFPASDLSFSIANTPPLLETTGAPGYENDGADPDVANAGEAVTFRVRYADPDASAREVSLRIGDGPSRTMMLESGDPAGGAVYTHVVDSLAAGTHAYHFTATDGAAQTRLPAGDANYTLRINAKPTLSYPGAAGYEDGVEPSPGLTTDTFTFRVVYADADGDAPAFVRVLLSGGPTLEMAHVSGEHATGATYEATATLPAGNVAYRFTTSDGLATAYLPASSFRTVSVLAPTWHNLTVNGGFDDGTLDGWTQSGTTVACTFGTTTDWSDTPSHSARITARTTSEACELRQDVPVRATRTYVLTASASGGDYPASLRLEWLGSDGAPLGTPSTHSFPLRQASAAKIEAKAPAGAANARVALHVDPGALAAFNLWSFDSIHLAFRNTPPAFAAVGDAGFEQDGADPDALNEGGSTLFRVRLRDQDGSGLTSAPRLNVTGVGNYLLSLQSGTLGWGAVYATTRTLPPGTHSYHFWVDDGFHGARFPAEGSFTVTVNRLPTLAFAGGPGYASDGVEPDDGNAGAPFVFKVLYTDPEGTTPQVEVFFDGEATGRPLAQESGSIGSGATFSLTRSDLAGGDHSYHFVATDGLGTVRLPATGSLPFRVNHLPTLSYQAVPGFEDGAHPDRANPGEPLAFRVVYADADGTPPASIAIRFDGEPDARPMTLVEGASAQGAVYEYVTSSLAEGAHRFAFEAGDGQAAARLPAEGEGSVSVNHLPSVAFTGEAGYAEDGLVPERANPQDEFVFRLRYADADGTPPAHVRVHLDGDATGVPMTLVSGDVGTGAVFEARLTGLASGGRAYHFEASDGEAPPLRLPASGALSFSVNHLPDLAPTGEAGYETDAVDPDRDNPQRELTFRVRYTDLDAQPPAYVRLHVDGDATGVAMTLVDGTPGAGAVYQHVLDDLPPGSHAYHLEASDGEATTRLPAQGSYPVSVNNPPALALTGEAGYETDAVEPDVPNAGEPAVFRVRYVDPDGTAPAYVRLHVDGGDGVPMTLVEGSVATGAVYQAEVSTLAPGQHSYRFEAGDGEAATSLPGDGTALAVRVNAPPRLEPTGEAGYEGDGVHPEGANPSDAHVFRIRYVDPDGTPPADVRVHLDGDATGVAMAPVAGDASGELFEATLTTLSSGGHSYHFTASDGHASARAPASGSYALQVNHLPRLEHTGEAGYEVDGADPDLVPEGGSITFRVRVLDDDGQIAHVRLHLDGDASGLDMAWAAGSVEGASGGSVYALTVTLAPGTHPYHFEVSDGQAVARLPETGAQAVRVDARPRLEHLGTGGYATDGADPDVVPEGSAARFRVRYVDPDGPLPEHMRVHVDGEPEGRTMTLVEGDDVAAGVVFALDETLAPGTYAYHFTAGAAGQSARLPAEGAHALVVDARPVLEYLGEEGYVTDGADPDVAAAGNVTRFRVRYVDPDGPFPAFVGLHLEGEPAPRGMALASGDDVAAGLVFALDAQLAPGTYGYHFTAGAAGQSARLPAEGALQAVVNRAPVLAYTEEPDYVHDGVEPQRGNPTTMFTFRVRYADADGNPADHVRVHFDGSAEGQDMALVAGDPATGAVYETTARLPEGSHSYRFAASDGHLSASFPDDRDLLLHVSHVPRLSFTGEPGYETDGANPDLVPEGGSVTLRVKVSDADGGVSPVRLHLDGDAAGVSMTLESGSVATGATYVATVTPSQGYHAYFFSVSDGENSARLPEVDAISFAIDGAPALAYTMEPGYVSDGAHPDAASAGAPIVFRVKYLDPDGPWPERVRVHFDGDAAGVEMTHELGSLATGATWSHAATFAGGAPTYHFTATAGDKTVRLPASGAHQVSINRLPTLSYTGEPSYAADGVQPDSGSDAETYVFRVRYADPDGTPPSHVRLHVDGFGGEPMTLVSGTIGEGAVYELSRKRAWGSYSYHFEASDGSATVRLPATGGLPLSVRSTPVLTASGEGAGNGASPVIGSVTDTYEFRTRWTSADGRPPQQVSVHIVRLNEECCTVLPMTLASGSPATGATYRATTTFASGAYGYYFTATDGHAQLRWPVEGYHGIRVEEPSARGVPVMYTWGCLNSCMDPAAFGQENINRDDEFTTYYFSLGFLDVDSSAPEYSPIVYLYVNGANVGPLDLAPGWTPAQAHQGINYHKYHRVPTISSYHFVADDGTHKVRWPPSGEFTTATEWTTSQGYPPSPSLPPTLRYYSIEGLFNDGARLDPQGREGMMEFGVSLWDPNPSIHPYPEVTVVFMSDEATHIPGAEYKVHLHPQSCTCDADRGIIYQYTLTVPEGATHYYFRAYDEDHVVKWPAVGVFDLAGSGWGVQLDDPPTLNWVNDGWYSGSGVHPYSGDTDTPFVFKVKYFDPQGRPADHVMLHLDGGPGILMANESDTFATGAVYTVTRKMAAGTHSYYFSAKEGQHTVTFGADWPWTLSVTQAPPPEVPPPSGPPVLSWTGEPAYVSDGVEPNAGTPGTTFRFRVKYSDPDNDPPASVRLVLDQDAALSYAMACPAGDYVAGVVCTYDGGWRDGGAATRSYHFEADDGDEAVRFPATQLPTFSLAPAVGLYDGVVRAASDLSKDVHTFRVSYKDPQGVAPSLVKVLVKPQGKEAYALPMMPALEVPGGPSRDYGAGWVFETPTHLLPGSYTYHFEATVGGSTLRFPAGADVLQGPAVRRSGLPPQPSLTYTMMKHGQVVSTPDTCTDFHFDARGSTDRSDLDSITYRWTWGDGSPDSFDPAPVHRFRMVHQESANLRIYADATLRVSDADTLAQGLAPASASMGRPLGLCVLQPNVRENGSIPAIGDGWLANDFFQLFVPPGTQATVALDSVNGGQFELYAFHSYQNMAKFVTNKADPSGSGRTLTLNGVGWWTLRVHHVSGDGEFGLTARPALTNAYAFFAGGSFDDSAVEWSMGTRGSGRAAPTDEDPLQGAGGSVGGFYHSGRRGLVLSANETGEGATAHRPMPMVTKFPATASTWMFIPQSTPQKPVFFKDFTVLSVGQRMESPTRIVHAIRVFLDTGPSGHVIGVQGTERIPLVAVEPQKWIHVRLLVERGAWSLFLDDVQVPTELKGMRGKGVWDSGIKPDHIAPLGTRTEGTDLYSVMPGSGTILLDDFQVAYGDLDGDKLPDTFENARVEVTFVGPGGATVTRMVDLNPYKADTDGDGRTDYDEIKGSTFAPWTSDPTDPDSDDDGISDGMAAVEAVRAEPGASNSMERSALRYAEVVCTGGPRAYEPRFAVFGAVGAELTVFGVEAGAGVAWDSSRPREVGPAFRGGLSRDEGLFGADLLLEAGARYESGDMSGIVTEMGWLIFSLGGTECGGFFAELSWPPKWLPTLHQARRIGGPPI